ncbi:MAG: tRNA pseudouridine(55) synthase TruB [Bacilli bacterium]|nr:tRNA pseudouridine(55) synthase TruB [Bacilli bacterium]
MIFINGVLIVNKPKDLTSRDVVNKLNCIFETKRIGHTGTLDPIATGVLVVAIGSYTKLVNELTSLDKEYIAEIKLGIKTDTGDVTGNILEENNNFNITNEDILNVLNSFPKEYEQTVPKYSAVKINGKKLYEYAREGISVELPKRLVNIYSLELLEFNNDIIKFKTKVSKGTYIRSLIEDICNKLGVLGTMNSLVRTKQGTFSIENAIKLDDVNINTPLLTSNDVLNIKDYILDEHLYKLVINGNKLNIDLSDGYYNMIYNNEEVAIYKFSYNEGRLVMFY